jgi:transcriptional regulator with XRE-family HTH domain
MPVPGSPTVRRRLLAAELRRLRASTGSTADEVGRAFGWSKAKISRYELSRGGLKPADVGLLLDFYGVSGTKRAELMALAEEARYKGWWESYSDVLPPEQMEYIGLEAEATTILDWQINVVPGLLQTEQYAMEILSGYRAAASISPLAIQRRLEARLIRQQLLTRDNPLKLVALLDESVLLRQRGDRSAMHAQLLQLAEAAELPSVAIQILPLSSRNHGLAVDSFSILRFSSLDGSADARLHDVVSIEHLSNELYVEGETDTNRFRLAFDHLTEECLSPEESRELILAIASQAWGEA